MKNVLNFEFYKLRKQKSLYIVSVIMIVLSLLNYLVMREFDESMITIKDLLLSCLSSSLFITLQGILLSIYFTSDFDNDTIKNVYSRGYGRYQVFFGKLIIAIAEITISYIVILLFNYILGAIKFSYGKFVVKDIWLLLGQYIYTLTYCSFVIAVCSWIKKMGGSIAISIVGFTVVSLVITLLDSLLKLKDFKLNDYWVDTFYSYLCDFESTNSQIVTSILGCLVYAVIFILAGMKLNDREK